MEYAFEFNSSQSLPHGCQPAVGPSDGIDTPDMDIFNWPLDKNAVFDWEAHNADSSSDPKYGQLSNWMMADMPGQTEMPSLPTMQGDPTVLLPETHLTTTGVPPSVNQPPELYRPVPMNRGLTDVTQFLDGSYCPPHPCSHCRRQRLQCLIIRTTPANPNPITSCSSCVALFRECSLAVGEKRQPSRFETLSPAIGHLHGLRELSEDVASADQVTTGLGQENELDFSMLDHMRDKTEPKESKQFIRKGARVLRAWFIQNQECPYPSEEQKGQLARETGFSKKRLSIWFANARRRQKQKMDFSGRPQLNRAGSPVPTSQWMAMTPLERWQASPPEDDPVPESAIRDAITSSTTESNLGDLPPGTDFLRNDSFLNFVASSSSLFDSSVSGFGSRQSEASSDSISTAWSHRSSNGSALPFPIKPPNRHKRRSSHAVEEHRYQCTFCPQSFKKKTDWNRHETSVHISLVSWVCIPDLADLVPTEPNPSACRFCPCLSPSQSHWEEHDFRVCAEKPIDQRSFLRKDHLWQHLRKFHGCTQAPVPDLDSWRLTRGDIRSRCGFCGLELSAWTVRADHLAGHFRKGARMDQWEGDWGLDAEISNVLRNATLPRRSSDLGA